MKRIWRVFAVMCVAGSITASADDNHSQLLLEAEALAKQSKDLPDGSNARNELTTKVKFLVEKSFDARQDSQRQQIQQMQKMLRQAETLLEDRAKIRDRIINRKVEDLLSEQTADWTDSNAPNEELFDVIGIGDIVAVYLPGVLPFDPPNTPTTQPQVNLLGSGRPVTGYPLAVGSDGAISMPLVDPIEVAGLSVRQAEAKIAKVYVDQDILRTEKARPTLTLIQKEEFPLQTSVSPAPEPSLAGSTGDRSLTPLVADVSPFGISSFDDTYGRISSAAESLSKIAALEREIVSNQNLLRLMDNNPGLKRSVFSAEQQLSMEKLKLQLVKDYLADEIEQLETDVQAKMTGMRHAKDDLARLEMLYKSGALTASENASARLRYAEKEAEVQKATLTLDRYQKTLARWNNIVGETLSDNENSEQRVDERSSR